MFPYPIMRFEIDQPCPFQTNGKLHTKHTVIEKDDPVVRILRTKRKKLELDIGVQQIPKTPPLRYSAPDAGSISIAQIPFVLRVKHRAYVIRGDR